MSCTPAWDSHCSQGTLLFASLVLFFFSQFPFLPSLCLCPSLFLFSLFTFLSVSPLFYICTHTHAHARKELNSVGPLLLHYVNYRFPSTTASFLSRLHFIHRMQISPKLSLSVYRYPLSASECVCLSVCMCGCAVYNNRWGGQICGYLCACAYIWAIWMQIRKSLGVGTSDHPYQSCVCMCVALSGPLIFFFFFFLFLTAPFNNHTIDEEGLSVPIFPQLLRDWPIRKSTWETQPIMRWISTTVEPSNHVGLENNFNYRWLEL